jgi:beta-N-acetylhexosaminidase
MRKPLLSAIAAIVAVSALAGCGKDDATSPAASPSNEAAATSTSSPIPTSEPAPTPTPNNEMPARPDDQAILDRINAMTTEEKVGQLAIIGLDGKTMSKDALAFIQDYHVGGFILFKDNIDSADQTLRLLNQLKESNADDPDSVPLWLSVDQEGGKVSRMPAEFAKFPTARQIAGNGDTGYTRAVGQALGAELGSLGFNMDFAPVLDINSNPSNPVIGDRAFGSDADTVSAHGLAMMDGISSQGIASVAKHFPGHGDTSVDSHKNLPVVDKSLKELLGFELLPFQEAISNDVDAIMVGHLLMTKLDNEHPASISKAVITDVLRGQLDYDGVVITDDMTMKGLTGGHDIGDAAVDAILAGGDILLVCHEYDLQKKVLDTVIERVKDGTIAQDRLDESVFRILSLKAEYALTDEPIAAVDPADVNAAVSGLLEPFAGSSR